MTFAPELSPALFRAYGLQPSELELIYDGVNKIFKFSASNAKLILKLFNRNNRNQYQISYERRIMKHVRANKIGCIEPLDPTSDKGEQVYLYLGQKYYGILTHEDKGATFTPENCHSQIPMFGTSLYKLHNCKRPNLVNPPPNLIDAFQLISHLKKSVDSPHASKLKVLILKLFDNIQAYPTMPESNDNLSICHGDAWPGNALYSENSCILLDFEHSRVSTPAFDISTFIWWALGQHNDSTNINAWKSLEQGYGDVLETRIDKNTPRYIKINELRSLAFIYNHILITDELFEHINKRTLWLMDALPPSLKGVEILELL